MTDLQSLIERVEKATGPDREVDARLCATLRAFSESEHYKLVVTRPPSSFSDWMVDCVLAPSGKVRSIVPPEYTASIDAALSLVSRALPGWGIEVSMSDRQMWRAQVWRWFSETNDERGQWLPCYSRTPALAIILALLRAKAAETEHSQ